MYRGQTVGVVVLAYRVENQIKEVIENLPDFVDRIYVIDDGSPDGTSEIVKMLDHGRLNLIQHETNLGPGGALSTGYRAALADGMEVVVKVDGDGQTPVEQIEDLIMPVVDGQVDYAKGDRLSIPEHRQGMPRFRIFGNLMLTWLTRIASGYWQLNDSQNGFTAISKRALETIDLNLYSYYGYLNDLLVQLNVRHLKILDVPMAAVYGEEKSSIRLSPYVPKVSLLLLRKLCCRIWKRYFSWIQN